jgi:hypothetical protein
MYTGPAAVQRVSRVSRDGFLGNQLTQCHSLANPDDHSSADEAAEIAVRRESLHEGRDDRDKAADAHAPSSAKEISL